MILRGLEKGTRRVMVIEIVKLSVWKRVFKENNRFLKLPSAELEEKINMQRETGCAESSV